MNALLRAAALPVSPPEPAPAPPERAEAARLARRGQHWPWFLAFLIVAPVAGLLVMVAIAVRDPSFAVEENYYLKELAWDDTARQRAANAALGWRVAVEPLTLPTAADAPVELVATLRDRAGAPISEARLSLEAFANARAGDKVRVELAPAGDGRYRGPLAARRPGLWELRFVALWADAKFTEVLRVELAAAGGEP
ncbi:MAG: FixH family protein [Myxococcales bacterium]|nr:FixH family protein [Myxococcales bacterium]